MKPIKQINKALIAMRLKKPLKKVETPQKPKPKPSFSELKKLLVKRNEHKDIIEHHKAEISKLQRKLAELEGKKQKTDSSSTHILALEQEIKFHEKSMNHLKKLYDTWYEEHGDVLNISKERANAIEHKEYHNRKIREAEATIRKLEEGPQKDYTDTYILNERNLIKEHIKWRGHFDDFIKNRLKSNKK